ncbi:MAG: precorrin-6B C5,15-methyltransferase / cobalt-precorrin-6B C5,C15-methyltransferase [Micromonosporaceae bacterium]|jgi:precorrin-6Y C5,15-methyltransferase (decarboxylating)|nr:precorrin-6B C5,15-methyltransferase / cobalt-precorrin-6B C5,C15-methyltransferase [Micromonosporaceae bacterium]
MRTVTVVGIGADGWAGLSDPARDYIRRAEVILGGARHLDLVPGASGERIAWPSPLLAALPGLLDAHADRAVCVLASGDPLFFGIGAALIRLLGPERVQVVPHQSSVSLACARLGWSWEDIEVVSLVGRPVDHLHRVVQPNQRLIVLSADGHTPATVAKLLTHRGYGPSWLTVLEQLGGPAERAVTARADSWTHATTDALNVIGVECQPDEATSGLSLVPGLPDEAFANDGQLTKRELRAITLARLAPMPGQLLWDVGAGAGSIAIEWMRGHRSCRAIAIESRPDRSARIASNAAELGVPHLEIVTGAAPEALDGLPRPNAIFVGGGATVPGVIEACWDALARRGRLVVNAVTLESERVVANWCDRIGGDLIRIAVSRASPVGGFTAWRPMMPVTQWTVDRA